ncbi:hypothetical protein KCP70_19785 [Salmonella enterica subsp. enterica]|nr:hypothetical protein KCP70_19785 [Salmonella enterica subsp. enterica]
MNGWDDFAGGRHVRGAAGSLRVAGLGNIVRIGAVEPARAVWNADIRRRSGFWGGEKCRRRYRDGKSRFG